MCHAVIQMLPPITTEVAEHIYGVHSSIDKQRMYQALAPGCPTK